MWNVPCNSACYVCGNSYRFSVCCILSEYASNSARKILKPMLELLAGIPTIVYGFALTIVTPLLQRIIPDLQFLMRLVQESLSDL